MCIKVFKIGDMEQFEGQDILNFIKELPKGDACKAYLSKIKWQDGYTCSK